MAEEVFIIDEIGGVQRKTNRFLMDKKDMWDLENVSSDEIGSAKKREGYAQRASDLTSTSSTSTSSSTTTTSTSTSTSSSTSTSTTTS